MLEFTARENHIKRPGKEKTIGVSFDFRLCPKSRKAISLAEISVTCIAIASRTKKLQGAGRNDEDKYSS